VSPSVLQTGKPDSRGREWCSSRRETDNASWESLHDMFANEQACPMQSRLAGSVADGPRKGHRLNQKCRPGCPRRRLFVKADSADLGPLAVCFQLSATTMGSFDTTMDSSVVSMGAESMQMTSNCPLRSWERRASIGSSRVISSTFGKDSWNFCSLSGRSPRIVVVVNPMDRFPNFPRMALSTEYFSLSTCSRVRRTSS
jgi:hypothetical protein